MMIDIDHMPRLLHNICHFLQPVCIAAVQGDKEIVPLSLFGGTAFFESLFPPEVLEIFREIGKIYTGFFLRVIVFYVTIQSHTGSDTVAVRTQMSGNGDRIRFFN